MSSDNKFAILLDGNLHLRQAIIPEFTKKDLKLPFYYYSYHDLKKELKKYPVYEETNSLEDIINTMFGK